VSIDIIQIDASHPSAKVLSKESPQSFVAEVFKKGLMFYVIGST